MYVVMVSSEIDHDAYHGYSSMPKIIVLCMCRDIVGNGPPEPTHQFTSFKAYIVHVHELDSIPLRGIGGTP